MYLQVYDQAVDQAVPATVKTVEDQGSFKILTVSLADHTLRARLPEGRRVPEREAWLKFPPERTKLFADERLVISTEKEQ